MAKQTFGLRLQAWRTAHGLTQEQLAKKCDWHPSLISHYENGTRLPGIKNLEDLCKATNTSPAYFMGFAEAMVPP